MYLDKLGHSMVDPESINGKYILQKFREGDKIAVEVIDEHTRLVGEGVAGFVNVFNPEQIVIGGGISESGDFYIEKIRAVAENRAMKDCYEGVEISAARLGNKAGFLGASYFAVSQLNKTKS
jgi:glucokinase